MSRHTARLGVVDLDGRLWPKLGLLDVEEIDVVSTDVDDGEKKE